MAYQIFNTFEPGSVDVGQLIEVEYLGFGFHHRYLAKILHVEYDCITAEVRYIWSSNKKDENGHPVWARLMSRGVVGIGERVQVSHGHIDKASLE
ncbi:hypothetical protein HOY34_04500 [Xinfangfangia sp. D13-10-4-6]|uniref:hypothetical protein n=1 Tax=Pseudogemmobacter hezensis TaxID=2737662 RepID=UPI0015580FB4|nr:hypothetical protein [Pseudogemmobacter hezensis]NPD14459.1 hypothetical protein [Pseudogemmobacter hezensis]